MHRFDFLNNPLYLYYCFKQSPRRTEYQEMATSLKSAEAEERRQRRLLITLFSIVFVGLGYVLYDYFRIINTQHLPENVGGMDQIVASWKTEGFVRSFDSSKAILIVDEAGWKRRRRSEKINILTQLARYCAEKKQSNSWAMTVLADGNGSVLAELGSTGFKVN